MDKLMKNVMLEPRELAIPEEISSRTLSGMDQTIRNFKLGQVSDPVDLSVKSL